MPHLEALDPHGRALPGRSGLLSTIGCVVGSAGAAVAGPGLRLTQHRAQAVGERLQPQAGKQPGVIDNRF